MKRFSHPFFQLLVLAAWSLALMVVSVFIGLAFGVAGESASTPGFLLWNVLVQLLTFAFPVLLVTRRYYPDSRLDFYRLDFSRRSWLLTLAGVAVLILLVPLIDWLTAWNDSWHFPGAWEPLERSLREAGDQSQQVVEDFMKECPLALNLFGLAFIPALCEELFFRVGVQTLLYKSFARSKFSIFNSRFSIHAAVWVTATLFSLAHGEVFAFLPRFLLGALLGYLFVYGRSLMVNVTAHFFNNAAIAVAYAFSNTQAIHQSGNQAVFDPSAPLAVPLLPTLLCTLAAAALFYFAFLRHPSRPENISIC